MRKKAFENLTKKFCEPRTWGVTLGTCTLFLIVSACSDEPKRERFPGPQGRTTESAAAETSQAVLGGFDPLNNRLPGQGAMGQAGGANSTMDWSAQKQESIRGVISLGPKVLLKEGMFLFISARSPQGGPPMAVYRDRAVQFPFKFILSKSNAMMAGTDFSGPVKLSIKLKQDPNPLSQNKGDYFALVDTSVGAADLKILLEKEVTEDVSP